MDCAVRETSSSAPAEAPVEPKAKPPAAAATPVITCPRIGKIIMAIKFVLSLIFVLHLIFTRPQRIRPLRQNIFKIIFYWHCPARSSAARPEAKRVILSKNEAHG